MFFHIMYFLPKFSGVVVSILSINKAPSLYLQPCHSLYLMFSCEKADCELTRIDRCVNQFTHVQGS